MVISRIPYVTLVLFVLNVIVYFVGVSAEAPYKTLVQTKERDLVGYYTQHPNVELAPETFEKLSQGSQQLMALSRSETLKVGETLEKVDDKLALMEHFLNSDDPSEPQKQEDEESMQAIIEAERQRRQAEFDVLVQAFEASLEKSFYKDFGFVPTQGSFKTMLTSMFLHDRFFQLAFNMLLLLGLGYAMEGAWHSIVFPIFYLSGGIFATIVYRLSASQSTIPLLGAAGALTALAGAFAVRSYDSDAVAGSLAKGIGVLVVSFGLLLGLRTSIVNWSAGDLIGGVLFGAVVAAVFRLTNFERNVLMPEEERKAEVAGEHLGRGMALLDDKKYDEAIEELKKAVDAEPENITADKELCKAYSLKGKRNLAVRRFKHIIAQHMKHDAIEDAVDDYVELSDLVPDVVFNTEHHFKIAAALEERAFQTSHERLHPEKKAEKERALFTKAAAAYRDFVTHQQKTAKTLDSAETIEALIRYADICASSLHLPKDAYKAYQTVMGLSHTSQEQKETIKPKIQRLMQMLSQQTQKPEAPATHQKDARQPRPSTTPRPNIPLQKRIKFLRETADSPKYPLKSVAPLNAKQIVAIPGGMDLGRGSDSSVSFQDIYAIFIAQFPEEQDEVKARKQGSQSVSQMLVADMFVGGQARPYRLRSDSIAYPQFLPRPKQKSVENFHQFLLHTIQQIDAVYLDQGTFEFLKNGKIPQFPSQKAVETHELNLWQQIAGMVRFHCEKCWEVYWVDNRKIPENGAQTKCAKCGNAIFVRKTK